MKYGKLMITACLLMTATACYKGPVTQCLPPPDDNFERIGFVVRDSNNENLLLANGNKLDINKLSVKQPCYEGSETAQASEKGILNFTVRLRGTNSAPCEQVLLQWGDNDIDTLSYLVIIEDGSCGSRYLADTSSLRLNGQKIGRDTVTDAAYRAIFTLKK